MTVDARIVLRFMGRLGDIVLRKYACCVRCWEDVGGLQRVVFRGMSEEDIPQGLYESAQYRH